MKSFDGGEGFGETVDSSIRSVDFAWVQGSNHLEWHFWMRSNFPNELKSHRAPSQNDGPMNHRISKCGDKHGAQRKTNAHEPCRENAREVKQNQARVIVLGEESRSEHESH